MLHDPVDTSHGQNSSSRNYIGMIWDPFSKATGLEIRSFDHGSYELPSASRMCQVLRACKTYSQQLACPRSLPKTK